MPTLGTYGTEYIPFIPSNILPLPGDNLSYDWMETISQFSQRYLKMATAIATVSPMSGTYNFNYSQLGCDKIPIFKIYYNNPGQGWSILSDQDADYISRIWYNIRAQFQNIGLGTADFVYTSPIGGNKAFYLIAYL